MFSLWTVADVPQWGRRRAENRKTFGTGPDVFPSLVFIKSPVSGCAAFHMASILMRSQTPNVKAHVGATTRSQGGVRRARRSALTFPDKVAQTQSARCATKAAAGLRLLSGGAGERLLSLSASCLYRCELLSGRTACLISPLWLSESAQVQAPAFR